MVREEMPVPSETETIEQFQERLEAWRRSNLSQQEIDRLNGRGENIFASAPQATELIGRAIPQDQEEVTSVPARFIRGEGLSIPALSTSEGHNTAPAQAYNESIARRNRDIVQSVERLETDIINLLTYDENGRLEAYISTIRNESVMSLNNFLREAKSMSEQVFSDYVLNNDFGDMKVFKMEDLRSMIRAEADAGQDRSTIRGALDYLNGDYVAISAKESFVGMDIPDMDRPTRCCGEVPYEDDDGDITCDCGDSHFYRKVDNSKKVRYGHFIMTFNKSTITGFFFGGAGLIQACGGDTTHPHYNHLYENTPCIGSHRQSIMDSLHGKDVQNFKEALSAMYQVQNVGRVDRHAGTCRGTTSTEVRDQGSMLESLGLYRSPLVSSSKEDIDKLLESYCRMSTISDPKNVFGAYKSLFENVDYDNPYMNLTECKAERIARNAKQDRLSLSQGNIPTPEELEQITMQFIRVATRAYVELYRFVHNDATREGAELTRGASTYKTSTAGVVLDYMIKHCQNRNSYNRSIIGEELTVASRNFLGSLDYLTEFVNSDDGKKLVHASVEFNRSRFAAKFPIITDSVLDDAMVTTIADNIISDRGSTWACSQNNSARPLELFGTRITRDFFNISNRSTIMCYLYILKYAKELNLLEIDVESVKNDEHTCPIEKAILLGENNG